jgi:N-acetylgalactosamine kinase
MKSGKKDIVGLKILISGNVPLAAGLSSSSSFTVCTALMGLFANNLHQEKEKVHYIEDIIAAERMTGMAGGGMDQTISVMGESGKAFFIEFNPIKTTPVPLPTGYCFVIANSLTPSAKVLTLGTRYNKRVVECVFAIEILRKRLNIGDSSVKLHTLRALQEYLKLSFDEVIKLVKENIQAKPYSVKDLEDIFGTSIKEKVNRIINNEVVLSSNTEYFPYE